jgi:hypothetical protein
MSVFGQNIRQNPSLTLMGRLLVAAYTLIIELKLAASFRAASGTLTWAFKRL